MPVHGIDPGGQAIAVDWASWMKCFWSAFGHCWGHFYTYTENRRLEVGPLAMPQVAYADNPKMFTFEEILWAARDRVSVAVFGAFSCEDSMFLQRVRMCAGLWSPHPVRDLVIRSD